VGNNAIIAETSKYLVIRVNGGVVTVQRIIPDSGFFNNFLVSHKIDRYALICIPIDSFIENLHAQTTLLHVQIPLEITKHPAEFARLA
jgi:hypothetical protein